LFHISVYEPIQNKAKTKCETLKGGATAYLKKGGWDDRLVCLH